MKFKPSTQELFTDKDELIKVLACPLKKKWEELSEVDGDKSCKSCSDCNRKVYDTSLFQDEELLNVVRKNNDMCLTVSAFQKNLTAII